MLTKRVSPQRYTVTSIPHLKGRRSVTISNGSFENGLKLRNAGLFEWQIAEGGEPQIGLSESVKRTGRYSLFLTFNSFQAVEFRTVWQRSRSTRTDVRI